MAKLKLDAGVVSWAIGHCAKFGDTDIFPRLLEYQWFLERQDEVSQFISEIDLNTYEPKAGVTYLAPKNLLGFRTADQLFPIDQLIFFASTLSISRDIEKQRAPQKNAFSYRLKPQKDFSLFPEACSYADWIDDQLRILKGDKKYKFILSTDIADFYQRINHHRLDNCLSAVTENPLRKVILKQLSVHRAKYSFGIPVGNNASRILSETLLIDTDKALIAEGFEYTRYVDDYRFFLKSEEEAYRILSFLAEHLYLTEGLTLSRQKTLIETRGEYFARVEPSNEGKDAEEIAIRELSNSIYETEEPDPKEIEKLARFNLVERLEDELKKVDPNANRVRVLLSALKSLRDPNVVPLLLERIRLVLPFMREVAILIENLGKDDTDSVQQLKPTFLKMLEGSFSYLPITRVWILDLFTNGPFTLDAKEFRRLESAIKSSDVLEQRQLLVCAGKNQMKTFFRKQRTNFDSLNDWSKTAFILGAKCLERDEFCHWSKSIRPRLDPLTKTSFLKWVSSLA